MTKDKRVGAIVSQLECQSEEKANYQFFLIREGHLFISF
jgi:hypothetical protein